MNSYSKSKVLEPVLDINSDIDKEKYMSDRNDNSMNILNEYRLIEESQRLFLEKVNTSDEISDDALLQLSGMPDVKLKEAIASRKEIGKEKDSSDRIKNYLCLDSNKSVTDIMANRFDLSQSNIDALKYGRGYRDSQIAAVNGFRWVDFEDGSGHLETKNGDSFFEYDKISDEILYPDGSYRSMHPDWRRYAEDTYRQMMENEQHGKSDSGKSLRDYMSMTRKTEIDIDASAFQQSEPVLNADWMYG